MRIIIILAILVTVYFSMFYFFPLIVSMSSLLLWGFMPFILALIISILIDPIVDYLAIKKNINRSAAVGLALTLVLILITLFVIFFASRLVIEMTRLYSSLPEYTKHFTNYGLDLMGQIRTYITNNPLPAEANDALQSNIQLVIKGMTDVIAAMTNFFFNLFTSLPSFFTIIIVSGVATFFISRDKAVIAKFIYSIIPKKYVRPSSLVIGEISSAVVGFFRAQTILISITGIITIIGLYTFKIEYAVTIGMIVGFFDLLPILGPGTVLVPWAIVVLFSGNYGLSVALLVLYGVLIVVRQLIEPKILSQNLGLHPLATLISLYVGLRFIGIWGIIIGPFLVILIKAIVKSTMPTR